MQQLGGGVPAQQKIRGRPGAAGAATPEHGPARVSAVRLLYDIAGRADDQSSVVRSERLTQWEWYAGRGSQVRVAVAGLLCRCRRRESDSEGKGREQRVES